MVIYKETRLLFSFVRINFIIFLHAFFVVIWYSIFRLYLLAGWLMNYVIFQLGITVRNSFGQAIFFPKNNYLQV